MRLRFLLGTAGSGKTLRCVTEIADHLRINPQGKSLALITPKQATFQLERQLLDQTGIQGYARLQVWSLERLASHVLRELKVSTDPLLSSQGRTMVLRSLLSQQRSGLRLFHATSRLPGFAQQLGEILSEFQQQRITPDQLSSLAQRVSGQPKLSDKLHDFALLYGGYLAVLSERHLQDSRNLLDLASEALRMAPVPGPAGICFEEIWVDGFAELNPQEAGLLLHLLPHCEGATIAFCLPSNPALDSSWTSPWAVLGSSYHRLRHQVEQVAGISVLVETLPSSPPGRFSLSPRLAHLESAWASPQTGGEAVPPEAPDQVRVLACSNMETEAAVAASLVAETIRNQGWRWRDIAILVRSLDSYHDLIRRALTREGIPFFLDRREPIAHHPLAELTRCALRTITWNWQYEDWFGYLKCGLVTAPSDSVDTLENEALARGWSGDVWACPFSIPDSPGLEASLEPLRQHLTAPLLRFRSRLGLSHGPSTPASGANAVAGRMVAQAIRELWMALDVPGQLEGMSSSANVGSHWGLGKAMHRTAWDEMERWLEEFGLAFGEEQAPLREWVGILDSGLSTLTVGAIPPSLDQVLVGAVDRSRNPDLRMLLVLGFNEGVFPPPPSKASLLTSQDREQLNGLGVDLLASPRAQLSRESYLGYIACTRSRERLVVLYSQMDRDGGPLNPSPFLGILKRALPDLVVETAIPPRSAWKRRGLSAPVLVPPEPLATRAGPSSASTSASEATSQQPDAGANALSILPQLAERLYGPVRFSSSVSRLEQFAACPFRFLVNCGLAADLREQFKIDARHRGSFQHEILARFHLHLGQSGKRWRDLTPEEGRKIIGRIAGEVSREYGAGLFQADETNLFTAQSLTESLQDFVAAQVQWMRATYRLDPQEVELGFGQQDDRLPPWELELPNGRRLCLRGAVDRVDVHLEPDSRVVRFVVMDYKSSARKLDPLLLKHGIQVQLPAYMAALTGIGAAVLGRQGWSLKPVGGFYLPLRAQSAREPHRAQALEEYAERRQKAYSHRGRFSLDGMDLLDAGWRDGQSSGQFSHAKKNKPDRRYADPLSEEEFTSLLEEVALVLKTMASRILEGDARIDPYVKGSHKNACEYCDYASVCRIDPWVHNFRRIT